MCYICIGSVRGSCGHKHRTLSGAAACLRRDRVGCKKQGGYSDRHVKRSSGADLFEAEHHEVEGLASGRLVVRVVGGEKRLIERKW